VGNHFQIGGFLKAATFTVRRLSARSGHRVPSGAASFSESGHAAATNIYLFRAISHALRIHRDIHKFLSGKTRPDSSGVRNMVNRITDINPALRAD